MVSLDLVTALIVGIPAAVVGSVVTWLLTHGGPERAAAKARLATNRNSVLLLLTELAEIHEVVSNEFPEHVTQATYWERFPLLETPAYEELRATGRVADLGLAVASQVNRLYAHVGRINERLNEINAEMRPMRLEDAEGTFGDAWRELQNEKGEFLREYAAAEAGLRRVPNAKPSIARSPT